ncbi:MAG TPA: class I SAM-dependent methyltransferase [Pseudolabrys sp.]|nr:class I SAM-dependent methyltransferase [Pseudolabrys sp.]
MFDETNLFSTLAARWHEVPVGRAERQSLREILPSDDRALLDWWQQRIDGLTKNDELFATDWPVHVYGPTFSGKHVIEVGPGIGKHGVPFLLQGARVTFVDVAEETLALIRRICALKKLGNCDFVHLRSQADLTRLPQNVDAVYANGSLHNAPAHLMKPEFVALAQALRLGGRFIALTYPKIRWQREGELPFDKWGEKTDGPGTPWVEWYDLDKMLAQLAPFTFRSLMSFDLWRGDVNWFDLIKVESPRQLSITGHPVALSTFECHPPARIEADPASLKITTAEPRWAYAASAPCPSFPARPGRIEWTLAIPRGAVGISALSDDGKECLAEKFVGADYTLAPHTARTFAIEIDDMSRARHFLIRNISTTGASYAIVSAVGYSVHYPTPERNKIGKTSALQNQ